MVEFARALAEMGWEILSTGGTARALREAGLPVTGVSAVTGFPEILDGRVKTLHPNIHAGILARADSEEHRRQLAAQGIAPIGIVAVNLYPFSRTVAREGVTLEEAVENIDIGGPAMVRAAAKNHAAVAVVVNPSRYPEIIAELDRCGEVASGTRLRLAAEAFAHTAGYDAHIAGYFRNLPELESEAFPPGLTLAYEKVQDLRYGENPQQQAAFYAAAGVRRGLAAVRQIQGKELSFNNINDLEAAWALAREFAGPAVVAVKHANPCGVGTADSVAEAYARAYWADPVSIFGGVVAVNRPVDGPTATAMIEIFLEVVAAPSFTREALAAFSRKEDIRLLEMPVAEAGKGSGETLELKQVSGGLLLQTADREPVEIASAAAVTARPPGAAELRDLAFAQTVVKHVKSNAIVVAAGGQTLGVGAGQMSRINAARLALAQAGEKARGAVMGSDAFFPFPDVVEEAAAAGITAIAQPGGSLKDRESIAACDRLGLAMVFTGRRYFKH